MNNIETANGYLVVERIGGLDVYREDIFVCELCGKSFSDFTYDEEIDSDELDSAIEDELDTLDVIEAISDPYNFI